jgi:predicted Zn-dependent protease
MLARRHLLCGCLAAGLVACDDPLSPPEVDRAALAAAQREIAAAPLPRANVRTGEEDRAMIFRVARRLSASAEPFCRRELGGACDFRLALLDSRDPNAFASGRNQVVVTTGMMRLLENDDELAAVLAHEFAHHIANHVSEGGWRTQAGAIAGAALGVVATQWLGIDIGLSRLGAQAGASAGRLAYSKADEREADYLGAYILARAGFDLDRAAGLWAKLTRLSDRTETGLLDSHPAGPERLAAWRKTAAEIESSADKMPRR